MEMALALLEQLKYAAENNTVPVVIIMVNGYGFCAGLFCINALR
jgi:enoyl-CoA hydratase/carnithine racemase